MAGNDASTTREYTYGGNRYKLCRTSLSETRLDIRHGQLPSKNPRHIHDLVRYTPFTTDEERIENDKLHTLQPGDHIMWRRPYVICHHAIVTRKQDEHGNSEVIHWSGKKIWTAEIRRENRNFREEYGALYRINYNTDIREKNPAALSLKRADALLGLQGYKPLTRNCENFARFCKTGENFNIQFPWLKMKLAQTARTTFLKFMTGVVIFVLTPYPWNWEALSSLLKKYEIWHAVVVLEILSLATDLMNLAFESRYSTSYLKPDKTQPKFMRVFEFLVGLPGAVIGIVIGGLIFGLEDLPGTGPLGVIKATTAAASCGIFGFIVAVPGKALGNALGAWLGKQWTTYRGHHPGPDAVVNEPERAAAREKMTRRYLSKQWFAPYILLWTFIYGIYLAAHFLQYQIYAESVEAICTTGKVFYHNKSYPCPGIVVFVQDFDDRFPTMLYEDGNTMLRRLCSFYPQNAADNATMQREIDKYLEQYGVNSPPFKCYYFPQDIRGTAIRQPMGDISCLSFIWAYFYSVSFCCVLIVILVCATWWDRHQFQRDENWLVTFLAVLGLTPYVV